MNLKDKVVLVTGSAHRVGKAILLALVREGAHAVIHYGGAYDAAQQTKAEIEALGRQALTVSSDLSDPAAIEALFAQIAAEYGRLDVLVNSAARFDKQPFDQITVDSWEKSMAVNLRAPFLSTQHAARLMRTTERPVGESALIVNISDLAGLYPWKSYVQHGVSKAGLLHLTRITARELAPDIRVNAILPGPILPPPGMDAEGQRWREVYSAVPLGRAGGADVIAQTVLYLAQNDYVTGAQINVDGGEALVGPANH